jgi:Uncharacterized protein conserved in bacteria
LYAFNGLDADLVGAQRIFPDGGKRFITGTRKGGAFHLIAPPIDTCWEYIGVVEGYATGLTVHEALGVPVYVAFDAGNLKPVCNEIRRVFPDRRIVVFADNDFQKEENTGLKKGADAARAIRGYLIAPDL